jgi:hypothetical protein
VVSMRQLKSYIYAFYANENHSASGYWTLILASKKSKLMLKLDGRATYGDEDGGHRKK